MQRERFVVLGVARARSEWFRSLAQWSTSAALPLEFVKCVSTEELRAHLATGRRWSAALLDGGLPSVDRELLAAARDAACPTMVVDDGRYGREWAALGAAAVLPWTFTRETLMDVLTAHAVMIGSDALPGSVAAPSPGEVRHGTVIAVCGPGGTGASTTAMAVAQELAHGRAENGPVVLADLALRADQAMLHDVRDVVPGVQELVDAHRDRRPAAAQVRALTFHIEVRGYDLLLGLRRPRHWSLLRPRSFEAAFTSLRAAYATVVCDITADVEGEDDGGSIDLEDRNVMARTVARQADVVVVVGAPGVKGLHSLAHVVGELLEFGVPARRLVPIVSQAPRNPRARAEIARSLAHLVPRAADDGADLAAPVFLPRRRIDAAVRDGAPLPSPLGALVAGAVRATLARSRPGVTVGPSLERVVPGSLGSWAAGGTP